MGEDRTLLEQRNCDRPGCPEKARFHFGVEEPEDHKRRVQAYVHGEHFVGRKWFPGDRIHLCGDHALELREECERKAEVDMLRGITRAT